MAANAGTDKAEAVAVELRLDRIQRLYNSLDPAPFNEKELAPPEARQAPASLRHHFELRRDSERRL